MPHQLNLTDETNVTLTDANPRKEVHGDEDVDALDLTMELQYSAGHFDQIFAEPDAIQAALFHGEEVIENNLKPLAFEKVTIDDLRFTINGSGIREMVFVPASCTLKHAEPRNGPVMAVKFTVSVYPEVNQIGPLCHLVKQHVKVTLVEAQTDVYGRTAGRGRDGVAGERR